LIKWLLPASLTLKINLVPLYLPTSTTSTIMSTDQDTSLDLNFQKWGSWWNGLKKIPSSSNRSRLSWHTWTVTFKNVNLAVRLEPFTYCNVLTFIRRTPNGCFQSFLLLPLFPVSLYFLSPLASVPCLSLGEPHPKNKFIAEKRWLLTCHP
jgi:hypothetical protein